MGILKHRKHKGEDVESANGHAENDNDDEKKAPNYDKGDEYDNLLRFVDDEAQKAQNAKFDGDDDGEGKQKRLWYAPWKKVKIASDKEEKVPEQWLNTPVNQGLQESEIETRRKPFGYNEFQSPKENQILKFISYFRGPILYVMEIAVILAAGLRDWIDFGVIIGILMLNATVGWYQEKQAGDIVAQLKAGIAMKATVIRDGQEKEIEAREVVVGDIVVLEEGSTIPADAKIIASYEDKDGSQARGILEKLDEKNRSREQGRNQDDDEEVDKGPSLISVDQSAITGESLAVDKYLGETAYYTCIVKRGKAYGIVNASAKQSFVGRTAALVMSSNERGHFQIVLGGIGDVLLLLVILFIFIVWIGGFFRGIAISEPAQNNLLVYSLIFLIIGVPVGLPCVTTTTMAVGAAYLARRKCIVQKLTAIESLAGVDILCSDKTGTLTANKLSLNEPYVVEGVDKDWFMTVAVLASSHNIKSLDPIDRITILSLKDYPKAQENLRGGWTTHKFSPFDPVSKRITAEVEKDGHRYTCAKGAPNAILKLAQFDHNIMANFKETSGDFARRGFRSLAVAVKEEGHEWELLGIMSMQDPPRSDSAATIQEAQDLGVHIKMLTGDAVAIARELAKQLRLGTNVYDSQQLIGGSSMTGSDIRDFVEAADGFAEVYPEHKYQVVEMLQQRGHLTAMTGDGVNDAPSLKKADCGIAVEGASDAARSAADVVFIAEGLNSIITSIKTARQIFHRMKSYIVYRIALCFHLEVYLMLSMLILNETIRVDLIVFLAIFADVATIAIAYDNAPYARSPVEWELPKVWIISTVMGLLLAAGTWIVRGSMFLPSGGIIQNYGSVQEVLFLEVAITESWVIFVTRLSQGKDSGPFEWPSWQLIGAVLGVDILASIFAIFGWLGGPGYPDPPDAKTNIVTVVRIWIYSFGVTMVVCFAYILLNKWTFLDNIGRKVRSKKDEKLENFLTEMQRMTFVHEQGPAGNDYYRMSTEKSKPNGQEQPKEQVQQPDQKKKQDGEKLQNDKSAEEKGKSDNDQTSNEQSEKKHVESQADSSGANRRSDSTVSNSDTATKVEGNDHE